MVKQLFGGNPFESNLLSNYSCPKVVKERFICHQEEEAAITYVEN